MPKEKTEVNETEEKPKFKFTPFVDSDSLPMCKTNKKGEFVAYGDAHYAYRRTDANHVEFLAFYRKPKGIVSKLVKTLKIRSGKNKDDAFFRLLKDNKMTEVD